METGRGLIGRVPQHEHVSTHWSYFFHHIKTHKFYFMLVNFLAKYRQNLIVQSHFLWNGKTLQIFVNLLPKNLVLEPHEPSFSMHKWQMVANFQGLKLNSLRPKIGRLQFGELVWRFFYFIFSIFSFWTRKLHISQALWEHQAHQILTPYEPVEKFCSKHILISFLCIFWRAPTCSQLPKDLRAWY